MMSRLIGGGTVSLFQGNPAVLSAAVAASKSRLMDFGGLELNRSSWVSALLGPCRCAGLVPAHNK